jgi:hypothetical protein
MADAVASADPDDPRDIPASSLLRYRDATLCVRALTRKLP